MVEWVPLPGWVLNVDRQATITAYEKLPLYWPSSCTCLYCENFNAASHLLPPEFIQLCSEAGMDPAKPIEVYELTPGTKEGTRLYAGWYHLVGLIVTRPNSEPSSGSASQLVGDFQVDFTDQPDLVQDGFPNPI